MIRVGVFRIDPDKITHVEHLTDADDKRYGVRVCFVGGPAVVLYENAESFLAELDRLEDWAGQPLPFDVNPTERCSWCGNPSASRPIYVLAVGQNGGIPAPFCSWGCVGSMAFEGKGIKAEASGGKS